MTEQDEFTALVQTQYGPMLVHRLDPWQTPPLMARGIGLDHMAIEALRKHLRAAGPDAVFVDIGANIGTFSMALRTDAARVVAFEAQRIIANMLCGSVALSGALNVEVHTVALGARAGYLEVPAFDYSQPLNFGGVEFGPEQREPLEQPRLHPSNPDHVDLRTLDSYHLSPSVMKIDVEGMELEVLAGARQTIRRHKPVMLIEHIKSGPALRQAIVDLGYTVEEVGMDYLCFPALLKAPTLVNARDWACVARMGGVGDNLIASSVLPGLRDRYGRLEVITQAPQGVVFENNPYIDKLTIWPENRPTMDALTWARFMGQRADEYAYMTHLSHTCEGSLAFFEAQTDFWRSDDARRQLANKSYLGHVHDMCGLPHDFAPGFYPTIEEQQRAAETKAFVAKSGGPVIGWCIKGSRLDKIYPWSGFVISRLIVELGASVIVLGAPGKDYEVAGQIQKHVIEQNGTDYGFHSANAGDPKTPDWPLRRILSQAMACDLVVTPDTGPAWAVACQPTPKVVLLSHASALNVTHGWVNTVTLTADPARVPCWPCHRLQDRWETCHKAPNLDAAACVSDISVTAVLAAVRAGLRS